MRHGAEFDALLRAVIDAPDETAPRLVLADWLQERDDPAHEAMRWAAIAMEDGLRKPQRTQAEKSSAWFFVRDVDLLNYELPVALYAHLSSGKQVTQWFTMYPDDTAAWLDILEAWRRCPFAKRPKVRSGTTA